MRRQRGPAIKRALRVEGFAAIRPADDPDRAAPFVEDVANVRITEIDPYRTASRTLAIVALEITVDALKGDYYRRVRNTAEQAYGRIASSGEPAK